MAITVDYITYVISVPQADLTFDSGTLYRMDTNAFRLSLKSIEASEEGIILQDTNIHNTEVVVAGITYARSFSILPPYSTEFENLQYTCLLEGSNNNVWDVASGFLVQNQAQIIPSNSAGLIVNSSSLTTADKEDIAVEVWDKDVDTSTAPDSFASILKDVHGQIDRAVHINTEEATNGNGYQQSPYNNWSDAVDYAENNGLLTLEVMADAVVDRQLKNFFIRGIGQPTIDLNGQNMDNTVIERCTVTGAMLGSVNVEQCALVSTQNMAGVFITVSVAGTLTVQSGASLIMTRVAPATVSSPWTLDMNTGGASSSAIHNITGGMVLANMDNAGDASHLHFAQGSITIDASCIAGSVVITGLVNVIDNSGAGCDVLVVSPSNVMTTDDYIELKTALD